MKLIILTLLFGLLGYSISKPLDTKDATEALVEIEKQRLIKFPEELEQPSAVEGKDKHDEAKRILQEIEKINQALGYVKKQADPTRSPAILDSSQYLFPNTGYQPFHVQSPQIMGANGETLLLPSIRSVKLDSVTYNKASEYNVPPTRKTQKQTKPNGEKPKEKPTPISFYFKPNRVEVPAPQTKAEEKLLPTHFVIPVRLYKHNKQQYLEKHTPQEYKIKGYKIVGDIDHFYGKTKFNKTTVAPNSTAKSTPKYHLFFLPEEIVAKNSLNDIKAVDSNSNETSSREEKLANRPNKAQSKSQPISASSTANTTNPPQIVRKRLGTKSKGNSNSVVSASSSTVVKITPTGTGQGTQVQIQQEQQPQQPTPSQQITQVIQAPQPTTVFTSSSQATKPSNANNNNNGNKNPLRPFLNVQTNNNNNNDNPNNNNNNNNNNPLRPFLNFQNNNNNNNGIKNRPLLELQNNINNINNATSNAIKTAFQNIFRLPFRQQDPNKPLNTVTEFPTIETMPLPAPQHNQHTVIQQSYNPFTTSSSGQLPPLPFYGNNDDFQNDHLDSDYKWDDENSSNDNSNSEDQYNYNGSLETEPEEKKIFGNLLKHRQEQQKEALKQGGIIIQRLKVRKGGIAIAGPGGVATAGSGGTAIVGPGGYALTHPRSLTIAGPGAKVIAIPSDVDLKDALQRTNLETKMFPREGRIVATGPAVYYAPPTGDYVEI